VVVLQRTDAIQILNTEASNFSLVNLRKLAQSSCVNVAPSLRLGISYGVGTMTRYLQLSLAKYGFVAGMLT
jgi:hypothetical protein